MNNRQERCETGRTRRARAVSGRRDAPSGEYRRDARAAAALPVIRDRYNSENVNNNRRWLGRRAVSDGLTRKRNNRGRNNSVLPAIVQV